MAVGKYRQWLKPEKLLQLEAWARDGLINEQIAKNIGIKRQTLQVWINSFPAISDAIKKGKEVVDIEVENAMVRRALGYEIEEVKTVIEQEPNGAKKTRIEKVKKHVAPDVTAQIFWLKNRRRDRWMDNPHRVSNDNELLELRKKELELKDF